VSWSASTASSSAGCMAPRARSGRSRQSTPTAPSPGLSSSTPAAGPTVQQDLRAGPAGRRRAPARRLAPGASDNGNESGRRVRGAAKPSGTTRNDGPCPARASTRPRRAVADDPRLHPVPGHVGTSLGKRPAKHYDRLRKTVDRTPLWRGGQRYVTGRETVRYPARRAFNTRGWIPGESRTVGGWGVSNGKPGAIRRAAGFG
jgi:hypothetical protein